MLPAHPTHVRRRTVAAGGGNSADRRPSGSRAAERWYSARRCPRDHVGLPCARSSTTASRCANRSEIAALHGGGGPAWTARLISGRLQFAFLFLFLGASHAPNGSRRGHATKTGFILTGAAVNADQSAADQRPRRVRGRRCALQLQALRARGEGAWAVQLVRTAGSGGPQPCPVDGDRPQHKSRTRGLAARLIRSSTRAAPDHGGSGEGGSALPRRSDGFDPSARQGRRVLSNMAVAPSRTVTP